MDNISTVKKPTNLIATISLVIVILGLIVSFVSFLILIILSY
jgi:hypothetical protein